MTPVYRKRPAAKKPKVDHRTAFQEVAMVLGGELVEGKRPDDAKVVVGHGPWKVWLDTYVVSTGQITVHYTRARAFFAGLRELRVSVRGVNVFDRLWRAVAGSARPGMSRTLLERYVVRGKPRARLPSLFMSSGLTGALLEAGKVSLTVHPASRSLRKRYGPDLGAVTCQVAETVTDVNRLTTLVRVAAAALDALASVGEAHREEVNHP